MIKTLFTKKILFEICPFVICLPSPFYFSLILGSCFAIAISIYAYTMYAIKQEKFLDDFDMPDPLAEDILAKKIK